VVERRNLIWLCATPLIAVGLLLLAFAPHRISEHLIIGYFFGTLFGHTTLAAAWTSFGPRPLLWRLPLSLVWLLALLVAFACNLTLHGGPAVEIVLIVAACVAGQFLFLQLPFWGLALTSGRRLRYCEANSLRPDPRETQFGIRQLMIFTTIVAVVLGVGRFAVRYLSDSPRLQGEWPIFVFLATAAIVMTLPLILAALLPRFAIPAVALVLLLIGLLTFWEVPLLERFHVGGGPDTLLVVFINSFTAAWVLSIVLIVRISGYRFGQPGTSGASV
jgi:hypothetical protein